jgi:hypothetical protein
LFPWHSQRFSVKIAQSTLKIFLEGLDQKIITGGDEEMIIKRMLLSLKENKPFTVLFSFIFIALPYSINEYWPHDQISQRFAVYILFLISIILVLLVSAIYCRPDKK